MPDPTHDTPVAPTTAAKAWIIAFAVLTLLVAGVAAGEADTTAPTTTVDALPSDVLVQLGDETVTRDQFEREFAIAARSTALQQGMEPTTELLAEFEAFRPQFLDQLATQLVLVQHADEIGVRAEADDVDDVVQQVRAAQADDDGFERYLEVSGFHDEAALRAVIERSMSVQNVIETLRADIDVTDAEVEAWYEANQDQVLTPEGPLPLDAIRDEIASVIVQEQVEGRVQELVAAAPLEVYLDRL